MTTEIIKGKFTSSLVFLRFWIECVIYFQFYFDETTDIGQIYTRVFDHHQFLSGEIEYFLKQFEVMLSYVCHVIGLRAMCAAISGSMCVIDWLFIRFWNFLSDKSQRSWDRKSLHHRAKHHRCKRHNCRTVSNFEPRESAVAEVQIGWYTHAVRRHFEPKKWSRFGNFIMI